MAQCSVESFTHRALYTEVAEVNLSAYVMGSMVECSMESFMYRDNRSKFICICLCRAINFCNLCEESMM